MIISLSFIPVTVGKAKGWVQLANISFLLAFEKGTRITLVNGEDVEVNESLDDLIRMIRAESKPRRS